MRLTNFDRYYIRDEQANAFGYDRTVCMQQHKEGARLEVKNEEKPEIKDCFVIDNSGDVVILEIGSIFEGVIGMRSGFDSVEDAEQWAERNNVVIAGEAGDYSYLCK